jgi:hypothetical protein
MWLALMQACGLGYELVAADLTVHVAPVEGDVGVFFDDTIPMRLELYGPEVDDGRVERKPYFGFIQTPVDAQVECVEAPILDAATSNEQLALFFRPNLDGYDGMVGGGVFENGGETTRREGHAEDVVAFNFPCLPDPIDHEVVFEWVVDRSAPVPYNDVP